VIRIQVKSIPRITYVSVCLLNGNNSPDDGLYTWSATQNATPKITGSLTKSFLCQKFQPITLEKLSNFEFAA